MEKFKKLLMMLMLCTFGMAFTACGGDGDDDGDTPADPSSIKEMLQGTWQAEDCVVKVMGQTIHMTIDEVKEWSGVSNFYDERLTFSGDRCNNWTYTLKGNKIHYNNVSDYDDTWFTVKVTDSKLSLTADMEEDGQSVTVTLNYRRVSRSRAFEPETAVSAMPIFNALKHVR